MRGRRKQRLQSYTHVSCGGSVLGQPVREHAQQFGFRFSVSRFLIGKCRTYRQMQPQSLR